MALMKMSQKYIQVSSLYFDSIWHHACKTGVTFTNMQKCGLYFFMVKRILFGEGPLQERLQEGLTQGFAFYESCLADKENLHYYDRLRDLAVFKSVPADKIKSTGYVVDTLEAAVWSLITTDSFEQALLKAVNLGDDTDTVGAIAGGLAGLYYGYASIPEEWLSAIRRREWIEGMCSPDRPR